ncbi:hypothetical protein [Chroococcus sp. FPU101]|uniref:hypothetical protein n=1 Tax=Chroococcus sp. FPU101 TaxID=1974212 RepID=UPI001AA811AC|nr:hypothetical protein [Chroococcus sp. FPU101]GFE69778.1 hypothetical protein CFPU101_23880 [Chroococcus sp. FPU101]
MYEQLGVYKYWLFAPRGEWWIKEQLKGYRLDEDSYRVITDARSEPLQIRLVIEGELISFYPEDNGEKLLIPDELAEALDQETTARLDAEARLEETQQRLADTETLLQQYREQ